METATEPQGEPPAAAVFDLDGTLVRSEERSRALWSAFLSGYRVPADEELLDALMGRRGADVLAERPHLFPGRTAAELVAEVLALNDRLTTLPAVEPVAGAVELVRAVAVTGDPLALVTSGPRDYATGLLDQLGLRGFFEVLVTGDDVVNGKPDPEGYLAACALLGVHPGRAVAFEDSPAGLAAARAAEMRCVGVATTKPIAVLAAADAVVPDLRAVSWPVTVDIMTTEEA